MAEHPALKNLYKEVVAGKYSWDRWGLFGCLADSVLNYINGDIIEIGCGESSIYLSKLAEKHNRRCFHCEYSKSGVKNMEDTKGYFGENSIVFNCTSDEFFKSVDFPPIALAFIDGDHEYEQVRKDFFSTLYNMVKNGFIFLHDTHPPDRSWTTPNKCGTVYALRHELEENRKGNGNHPFDNFSFDVFTFPFSAFNVGLTMIRVKSIEYGDIDYAD